MAPNYFFSPFGMGFGGPMVGYGGYGYGGYGGGLSMGPIITFLAVAAGIYALSNIFGNQQRSQEYADGDDGDYEYGQPPVTVAKI